MEGKPNNLHPLEHGKRVNYHAVGILSCWGGIIICGIGGIFRLAASLGIGVFRLGSFFSRRPCRGFADLYRQMVHMSALRFSFDIICLIHIVWISLIHLMCASFVYVITQGGCLSLLE